MVRLCRSLGSLPSWDPRFHRYGRSRSRPELVWPHIEWQDGAWDLLGSCAVRIGHHARLVYFHPSSPHSVSAATVEKETHPTHRGLLNGASVRTMKKNRSICPELKLLRAVVATVLSLVYRILLYKDTVDPTWYLYAMLLCTYVSDPLMQLPPRPLGRKSRGSHYGHQHSIVELNISIIVCSMPGFAKFVRLHVRVWISLALRWSKSSSREELHSSRRGLWKMDSPQTGPAEPATPFPRKPQALVLACHPASHSSQPDANMSDEHYELMGSGKLHHPNTQSYDPDSSWLAD